MQSFTQAFTDPKTLCQSDLSLAPSDFIMGCFNGFTVREHRRRNISEVPLKLSFQTNEGMTIRCISRYLRASGSQSQCSLDLVAGPSPNGSAQIRFCCPFIASAVKM